jgi:hypothetical protein
VVDDDYRIHYTITSPAFRRLYFSAVYSVGRVVERELSVLNEGKEKWAFETQSAANALNLESIM